MANKKEESSLTSFGQRLVSSERQAKRTGGAAARAPTVECMDPSFCPKVLQGLHNGIIRTWDSFLRNRESKVMVIYTGGTIGMAKDVHGVLVPMPGILEKRLRDFPQLHDREYVDAHFPELENPPLVLPLTGDPKRVVYFIYEYDPLLDSSNATMDDWICIARDIELNYKDFDGFVILHGTDTMAYTASALSFVFENLGKSVIITGSQIPVFEPRSDGRDNLLNALILAGNYAIPEVGLMFHNQLFRGNRTSKFSVDQLDAFASFNLRPLATIGTHIEIEWNLVESRRRLEPAAPKLFRAHDLLNRNVGLLRFFPSITLEVVHAFLRPPVQGVVLQTYGAGNAPTARLDIMDEIRSANERGVLLLNCSQCPQGAVDPAYETGNALLEAGVIPGSDMTPEAALTKLSYVLSKTEWTHETKKKMLRENLRGELTVSAPNTKTGQ